MKPVFQALSERGILPEAQESRENKSWFVSELDNPVLGRDTSKGKE
jgi:hypothetical protein